MKGWRKLCLALCVVVLTAGLAFAEMEAQSICDPTCKDGLLFIGDMFYDGPFCEAMFPEQDCPCEHLNWPLDGAIWGCDFGFLNTGVCQIPAQQWDLKGLTPHKMVWSESQKILFISYLNNHKFLTDEGPSGPPQGSNAAKKPPQGPEPIDMGSPLVSVVDMSKGEAFQLNPYNFDDIFQKNIKVGALALDDERHLLYVANLDPADATVTVLNVADPKFPTKPICDPAIDLCAECDCDCNYMNMDMVYFKNRLYVSYFDTNVEEGIGFGDPMIAVFNADPDSPAYGDQVDCIRVVLDCPCVDANDSYFLAANLAVTEVDGQVIVLSTYHPYFVMGDFAALHLLGIWEMEWEDYVDRPLGVITATNMSTRETIYADLNSAAFREKLIHAGIDMCDFERLNLRAIDVNPCGCGDCEDQVIYLSAMKYDFGTDWSERYGCPCLPFDEEFNFEAAIFPTQGYVLALSLFTGECNVGDEIDFIGYKELPQKELCWCDEGGTWPWSPGDLVATSWVRETNLSIGAPVAAAGSVTVKATFLADQLYTELPFNFKWDPAVLGFASHKISIEGQDGFKISAPSDQTAGDFSWADILKDFQVGLSKGDTLTLEMTFTPLKAVSSTSVIAVTDGFAGYECFAVAVPDGGDDECPCDPSDDDVTVQTGSAVVPEDSKFTGQALYFQILCEDDEASIDNPLFIDFFFASDGGRSAFVNTYRWDDTGKEWKGVAGAAIDALTSPDEGWPAGMNFALKSTLPGGDDLCGGIFALSAATEEEMNPDNGDDGEPSADDGSSGCSVGAFGPAALLFVVPLVSFFRKR